MNKPTKGEMSMRFSAKSKKQQGRPKETAPCPVCAARSTLAAPEPTKTPRLVRKLLDVACRMRVGETLFHDDELVDEAAHLIVALQGADPMLGWRRECDDADEVLRQIGLDPEQCRTDGGSLNVPRIKTLLAERAGDPPHM